MDGLMLHNFRLARQYAGQQTTLYATFETEEEMQRELARLRKHHFIGTVLPQVYRGEAGWQDDLSYLSENTPGGRDQQVALASAGKLLLTLSKQTAPLSHAQVSEMHQVIQNALATIGG